MGNIIHFIRRKISALKKPRQTTKEQSPKEQTTKEQTPKERTVREQTPKEQIIKEQTPKEQITKEQKKYVNALLIVDVQYDFIDGTLALKDCPSQHQGEQVIPILNKLLKELQFEVVVYTQDWHTVDHISFFDNLPLRKDLLAKDAKPFEELKMFDTAVFVFKDDPRKARVEQILWPVHCVQHTHGAEIHEDLSILKPSKSCQVIKLLKGFESDVDSYSAFWDNQKISETPLNEKLREHNVNQVFIGGIATDVCVYSTALHACEYGYKTYIIEDACRGVDENNIHLRLDELLARGCLVTQSTDIKNLL